MDEFGTVQTRDLRRQGGAGWTLAAVVLLLLGLGGIILLGSDGGDITTTDPEAVAPAADPAPVVTD